MNKPVEALDPYLSYIFLQNRQAEGNPIIHSMIHVLQPTIAPKRATSPCQGKVDNRSSRRSHDLYNFYTQKKMRKQAKTHQCYSSKPVYSPKTSYENFLFKEKKRGEKHRTSSGVLPQHFTVIKKIGGLVVQQRKANLRRATLTIMHKNFRKTFGGI